MAQGLGQFAGDFTSPALPDAGMATWDQLSGIDVDDPYVAGPQVGGFAPDPDGSTGLVRIAAGSTPAEDSGMQHWSELLNWRGSPMPWFLLTVVLFLGLASLSVSARVGR